LLRPGLWLILALQAGCVGLPLVRPLSEVIAMRDAARSADKDTVTGANARLQQVGYQTEEKPETLPVPSTKAPDPQQDADPADRHAQAKPKQGPQASPPFEGLDEFPVESLVREVLARNPTLAQMTAAWQAASARYPQVTSLDDPMFGATMAPASIGSHEVDFGYRLEISQKYPWCDKLRLRGENALAEARAAGNDVEDTRLQLIESARDAFSEYYLVGRALAVNKETVERLRQFRQAAEALYKSPPKDRKVSFQEVIQADVEIGRQQERLLTLERRQQVAIARLNTLMHLPPDSPMPPPPRKLQLEKGVPEASVLSARALAQRPDLRALAEHIRAEGASLGLADKEFFPDFEVMAAYDAFWQEKDLRPQLAVRMNLPIRTARRHGAVDEAQARIAQRRAELDRLIDQVRFQVQDALAQVRESDQAVRLYEQTILPDADLNVKTARKDYETGQVPAVSVIDAERNRLNLYNRYHEVIADYFRRRATLERAVGGPLGLSPGAGAGPPGSFPAASAGRECVP
jgi:outer membrane protein TolC